MTERMPEEPEQVLEGTWEEVIRRAAGLKGHRVKLLVYSHEEEQQASTDEETAGPKNLLEALGDYVGAASSGEAECLSEDTGRRFTDYLVQKRRKGRL